ncbi:MAG: hypothetical protein RR791_05220, partial [Lachnospiraceae bacterium]
MDKYDHQKILDIKQLEQTYSQAAIQCGVTLWMLDFASKTIYNFNNATRITAFDHISIIEHIPEVFLWPDSPLHPDDAPALL